jgi:hypothetical protein
MADIVLITDGPVRHTSNDIQELRLAVDVSGYDELDLLLTVQDDIGTDISVRILTAMQMESEEGWTVVGSAFNTIGAGSSTKRNLSGFLKYVRYELVTNTTATFEVSGVGRRWA